MNLNKRLIAGGVVAALMQGNSYSIQSVAAEDLPVIESPTALDGPAKWEAAFAKARGGVQGGKTRSVVPEGGSGFKPAVQNKADRPAVGLDVAINFKLNSWRIASEWEKALDGLAAHLKKDTALTLNIEGHTDARGNPGYNDLLSKKRANAVRDYLVKAVPEVEPRLMAVGWGARQPRVKTDPYDPSNRRVSFTPK